MAKRYGVKRVGAAALGTIFAAMVPAAAHAAELRFVVTPGEAALAVHGFQKPTIRVTVKEGDGDLQRSDGTVVMDPVRALLCHVSGGCPAGEEENAAHQDSRAALVPIPPRKPTVLAIVQEPDAFIPPNDEQSGQGSDLPAVNVEEAAVEKLTERPPLTEAEIATFGDDALAAWRENSGTLVGAPFGGLGQTEVAVSNDEVWGYAAVSDAIELCGMVGGGVGGIGLLAWALLRRRSNDGTRLPLSEANNEPPLLAEIAVRIVTADRNGCEMDAQRTVVAWLAREHRATVVAMARHFGV